MFRPIPQINPPAKRAQRPIKASAVRYFSWQDNSRNKPFNGRKFMSKCSCSACKIGFMPTHGFIGFPGMRGQGIPRHLREEVTDAIIKRAFKEQQEELKKEEGQIAQAVYDDLYSPDMQEKMAALPEDFFTRVHNIEIHILGAENIPNSKGNDPHQIGAHHTFILDFPESRLAASVHGHNNRIQGRHLPRYTSKNKPEMIERFRAWQEACKAHDKAADKLRDQIKEMMARCASLDQLLKEWPELADILQDIQQQEEEVSIVALRQSLNEAIGLEPQADQKRFADVGWHIGDVFEEIGALGTPTMTDAEAAAFLERNSNRIKDAMVSAGHDIIRARLEAEHSESESA
jgi:hypothetical protein